MLLQMGSWKSAKVEGKLVRSTVGRERLTVWAIVVVMGWSDSEYF